MSWGYLFILGLLAVYCFFSIKIVKAPNKVIVYRFGKAIDYRDDGMQIVFPIFETYKLVDCSVQTLTEDVEVDCSDDSGKVQVNVSYQIINPINATVRAGNYLSLLKQSVHAIVQQCIEGVGKLDDLVDLKGNEIWANVKPKLTSSTTFPNLPIEFTSKQQFTDELQEYGLLIKSVKVNDIVFRPDAEEDRRQVLKAEKAIQARAMQGQATAAAITRIANDLKISNEEATKIYLTEIMTNKADKISPVIIGEDARQFMPGILTPKKP